MRWNLRHNLALKLFSIILAVVGWYVVRSEEERVRDFAVPLEYVNLNPNLSLSGKTIDTVMVRVRAPEPLLRSITEDRLTARIDLSHAPPGEQFVTLRPEMIDAPGGTEVTRVSPEAVQVRVENRLRREVPVVAELTGAPALGYELAGHAIDPPVVQIEGPASEVAHVRSALAGTIVLDGEKGDFEVAARPVADAPPGSRVRVVTPATPVRIHVRIRPVEASDPRSRNR